MTQWYNNWQSRWSDAYFNSPTLARVAQPLAATFNDIPAFQRYLQLRDRVINLIPTLSNKPAVKRVANLTADVLSNPEVAKKISTYYNEYNTKISNILEWSNYKAEVERYYENLNGLINANPTYQQLKQINDLAVVGLELYQKKVHDVMAEGYRLYGSSYDPYYDTNVLSLLPDNNPNNANFIRLVGQFYEESNKFWYKFYNSPAYKRLENNALARIQVAIKPIQSYLKAAQAQFNSDVNNIPEIKALQNAQSNLASVLRRQSPQLNSLLNQMEALAIQLNNTRVGTNGNDKIVGDVQKNTLIGKRGNDLLNGAAGNDIMKGGVGNDSYIVNSLGDVVIEAPNQGNDTVFSAVKRTLTANVDNLTLLGTTNLNGAGNALNNRLTGNRGNNILNGLAGNDILNGGVGNDILIGSSGNDVLVGGLGRDTLTGGAGADRFTFNSRREGIDRITDFVPVADTIAVSAAGFGGRLKSGILAASEFVMGIRARDINDRFIYNRATGALFFDADGIGAIAPIQIANLNQGLFLTNTDIFVIQQPFTFG